MLYPAVRRGETCLRSFPSIHRMPSALQVPSALMRQKIKEEGATGPREREREKGNQRTLSVAKPRFTQTRKTQGERERMCCPSLCVCMHTRLLNY